MLRLQTRECIAHSYKRLKLALAARLRGSSSAPEDQLVLQLGEDTAIGAPVIHAALDRMQVENLILLADGHVFHVA